MNTSITQTAIDTLLTKGVSTIIDAENIKKRLASGEKLRIKFGIDPTGTIVHLGHMVPILKLRAFQDLGHQIVLIIGDSTAQVGDTSDKDGERPMLAREQTRKNAENWIGLFGKVLDIEKVEVRYNSEWMDATNFNMVGELASHFSVAEMLDRENFSKRIKSGVRISLQEFLYPVMQGYDSVKIRADIELGGNDQYFNLLAGRTLQDAYEQKKQDIMTFELLIGPDGKKMSKTSPNCISINMEPNAMFVKLMEVKDELIIDYFKLATLLTLDEVESYRARLASGEHPRNIKLELAKTVVSLYHSAEAAEQGQAYFEKVLSEGLMPSKDEMEKTVIGSSQIKIVPLLKEIGFFPTTGEARNAVTGGGVKIDGVVISDIETVITLSSSEGQIVQAGKKKFKLVFSAA
ncbi:MAG: tyrosine--tRNA ligase [Patescibacteria group bacterium]